MSTIDNFNTPTHFSLFESSPHTVFKDNVVKAKESNPSSPLKVRSNPLRPIENILTYNTKKINFNLKPESLLFFGENMPNKLESSKSFHAKKGSTVSSSVSSFENRCRNAELNTISRPLSFLESSPNQAFVTCAIPRTEWMPNHRCLTSLAASSYELVEASLDKIKFKDGDFARAIKAGCFKIKIPSELDFQPGRNFAKWIAQNPEKQPGEWDKERHLQKVEWVNQLAKFKSLLKDIGLKTLERCLIELNIPKQYWHQATSGAIYDFGQNVFKLTYNSIQQDKENIFYDMGYVTVSDCIPTGLKIETATGLHPIEASDKFCLVSFGRSMESLTYMSSMPIKPFIYRNTADDTSYNSTKLYLLPPAQGEMWTYTNEGLERFGSRESFLDVRRDDVA